MGWLKDNWRSVAGGAAGYMLGGPAGAFIGAQLGGQADANSANVALGRDQMAFQERMSSTAYQRSRQDMINAGLNPLLMASQGGASTPTGAMPVMENIMEGASSNAPELIRMKTEIGKTQSETDLNRKTEKLVQAQTASAQADARKKDIEAKVYEIFNSPIMRTKKVVEKMENAASKAGQNIHNAIRSKP